LTAGSTAAAAPIRVLRADDRRISLPGIRLPLSADSKVTGLPGQMPIIAQRWPRTGSARKSAIRSPNASSPRCSGAPPAAGHAPGSPKRSDHPYPSNAVTRQQRIGVAGLRRHLRYVTAAATGVRPDRRLFSRPASARRTVEISTDRPLRRRPGDRQIMSPAVAHTSLYWPTCATTSLPSPPPGN
jgi:hypothetical protein